MPELNKLRSTDPSLLQSSSRSVSNSDLSEVDTHSNADSIEFDAKANPKFLASLNELNQEEKINALTSNIQLLISNKAKLEQGFQAEKKRLRVSNLLPETH